LNWKECLEKMKSEGINLWFIWPISIWKDYLH
jgi:hypothetical protein